MSKRNYGEFNDDENDPFDDGEYRGDRDYGAGTNARGEDKPTFSKLMRKMWGKDANDSNFDFLNETNSSMDANGGGGGAADNNNNNNYQGNRQQKQKKPTSNKRNKKSAPAGRNDDDDDDDDDDEHPRPGAGAGGDDDEGSRKDSNIGGNTKNDQQNRFFGFKGVPLTQLAEMNGEGIEENVDEKEYVENMMKKCNSTVPKEREEARKQLMSRQFVHPQIKKSFCKVCDFIDANLYSLQRFAEAEGAASQITRHYDLAVCGHKDETQLFHEMTQLYNAYKAKVAGPNGHIDYLFQVKEIAFCYRKHNKMNLKRVLVKGIHTTQVLQQEALMHVKGETRTGQKIFQPGVGKFVIDMIDKEVNYTARLIQTDMMIQESGILTAARNAGVFTSNRGMISGFSNKAYKNGANAMKSSFYNKTGQTGKYAGHTM